LDEERLDDDRDDESREQQARELGQEGSLLRFLRRLLDNGIRLVGVWKTQSRSSLMRADFPTLSRR